MNHMLKAQALAKAHRVAASFPHGIRIFDRIRQPDAIAGMLEKISEFKPPVSAVSGLLTTEEIAEPAVLQDHGVRKKIGVMVKGILAQEDFAVFETGKRIPDDPIFSSGATYRREIDPAESDLLMRIVGILTPAERERLLDMLGA